MLINPQNLSGKQLDFAVMLALGLPYMKERNSVTVILDEDGNTTFPGVDELDLSYFSPSSYWSLGGPILDKYNIELCLAKEGGHHPSAKWAALMRNRGFGFGETQLIAAMRCFVISILGSDDIEIPDFLKE